MASIPNPLGPAARFLRAFRASKAGVKPGQFARPIFARGAQQSQTRLNQLKNEFGSLAKARRQLGTVFFDPIKRNAAPQFSDISPAERYGGILGKGYRKIEPQQLPLPGFEQDYGRVLSNKELSGLRKSAAHADLKEAIKGDLQANPTVKTFLKGTSTWKYGKVTRNDTGKLAYKLGKLFRPGTKLRTTVPALFADAQNRGHRLLWDNRYRLRGLGNQLRQAKYRAALKLRTSSEQAVQKTVGGINKATANRWDFPTKIRVKPEDELTRMSELGGTGREGRFRITAGHAPLTSVRARAEDYGRKVVITTPDLQSDRFSSPIPHGARFSIHPGARMGERVKNLRNAFRELRKSYPGAHDWQMTRTVAKGPKAGQPHTRTLRITRPH